MFYDFESSSDAGNAAITYEAFGEARFTTSAKEGSRAGDFYGSGSSGSAHFRRSGGEISFGLGDFTLEAWIFAKSKWQTATTKERALPSSRICLRPLTKNQLALHRESP